MLSYFPDPRKPVPHRHSPAHEQDLLALGLAVRFAAAGGLTRALRAFLGPHLDVSHRRAELRARERRE